MVPQKPCARTKIGNTSKAKGHIVKKNKLKKSIHQKKKEYWFGRWVVKHRGTSRLVQSVTHQQQPPHILLSISSTSFIIILISLSLLPNKYHQNLLFSRHLYFWFHRFMSQNIHQIDKTLIRNLK